MKEFVHGWSLAGQAPIRTDVGGPVERRKWQKVGWPACPDWGLIRAWLAAGRGNG